MPTWMNRYTGAIAGVTGTVTLWIMLGLPTPVFSGDLKRLEQEIGRLEASHIETTIRLNEDQLDRLIIRREQFRSDGLTSFNPAVVATDRQIERIQEDLREARRRRVTLSQQ